ncbi:MAG: glutamine-hydrolyzing GMP synthase [Chloroflexota bacterium]|nr:glutamine-hydrolyzing GMP synthase [Chloroflexota bacterium]
MGSDQRETVVVLDYGSQYNQLIVRRVRECHVYCEMVPWDVSAETLQALNPKGIILSGGPDSVYDEGAPQLLPHIVGQGVPILGICYGMQLLGRYFGSRIAPAEAREYGLAQLELDHVQASLFQGLESPLEVWMSHGDHIEELPPGFEVIGHSRNSPIAAMADEKRQLYGLQFHPEVAHTPRGRDILCNFCLEICDCRGNWTMGAFIEKQVADIRERVGDGRVICAVSGGVDSMVVATLVHRAVGDQLTAIFVDTGLMRKGEAEDNMARFSRYLEGSVVHIDARERFLSALAGVTDPERKRMIIGREFIAIFEEEARKLGRVDFLAQGTLYPDVIESAALANGSAARIKTHHNVGGLPEKMNLELIEPLRFLFKDEVREVGSALGLPDEVVYRQPFPGPGLAVRIVGEVTPRRVALLQEADAIVREEVALAGLDRDIWQYFAVLTSLRSVGVMGDSRTYEHTVAIRAVTSEDGMTADWAKIPYEVLGRMANRIVNEVAGVNRVVYDISSKPPATIEWE